MQSVIWIIKFRDGSFTREFDENEKETVLSRKLLEGKLDFDSIGLLDRVNKRSYCIDLSSGEISLDGKLVNPAKEMEGRIFSIANLPGVDYRSGVIQYKVSNPMFINSGAPVTPESFNIGYKIKLPDNFMPHRRNGGSASYDGAQVILSVNSRTLTPSVAITFTAKTVHPDGREEMIRI